MWEGGGTLSHVSSSRVPFSSPLLSQYMVSVMVWSSATKSRSLKSINRSVWYRTESLMGAQGGEAKKTKITATVRVSLCLRSCDNAINWRFWIARSRCGLGHQLLIQRIESNDRTFQLALMTDRQPPPPPWPHQANQKFTQKIESPSLVHSKCSNKSKWKWQKICFVPD